MTYKVVPLRLDEHREALARLWAENMIDERIASVIPRRMSWLYEPGPAGSVTTLLALHSESGEVVGCGSFFPRSVWVDGRRVRAGVLCDFVVTRAHRFAGAAIAIQRALMEAGHSAGLELFCGYPNEQAIAVFKRIGYRVVGETTNWVKPLRSGYKLQEINRWAGPVVSLPIDLGLRVLDLARSARDGLPVRGEVIPFADRRADALWERARAAYCVVGEKSSTYLDWRYGCFVTMEHRIFGIIARGEERLAGYAVYAVKGGEAFVRDLFAERLEASAGALLLALAGHLRRQGINKVSLSYLGSPLFVERLRRAGFMRRPGKRKLVIYLEGLDESLRVRVLDPANWFMLDGELDI